MEIASIVLDYVVDFYAFGSSQKVNVTYDTTCIQFYGKWLKWGFGIQLKREKEKNQSPERFKYTTRQSVGNKSSDDKVIDMNLRMYKSRFPC